MAFNNDHLVLDYQFGIFKNGRYSYETIDSLATVNTAGYFNAAQATFKRRLLVGDEILVTTWGTAVPAGPHPVSTDTYTRALVQVKDCTDTTVDVTDGDARTMTDSD